MINEEILARNYFLFEKNIDQLLQSWSAGAGIAPPAALHEEEKQVEEEKEKLEEEEEGEEE